MKNLVLKGDTGRIEYIFIQDLSVTTGAGLTGLVFNSAGLTADYVRMEGARVNIALATQTVTGAFSSGGFVAVDGTNMPGLYRFDPPDACFATGVDKVVIMLKGAANMAPVLLEYQLVNFDPEDAADLGLTNLDATVSSRASQTSVDTLDNFVDTEIADIQARLPAALTGAGNVKADVLAIAGSATAATRLGRTLAVIATGTVSGSPTTTSVPASDLPGGLDNDSLKDRVVIFDGNVTAGIANEPRAITAYNGTTKILTVAVMTTAPAVGDTLIIV